MTTVEATLPAPRSRLGPLARAWAFARHHLLSLYSLLFFAYLLLPIGVVIAFSFNNPKGRFNYTWQGFTFKNWSQWNGVPGLTSALWLSLEQIDPRMLEAAEDLYASKLHAFLRVTLPLSLPGIVAGTLLTFIPAAGDFINAQLLGGPDNHMIGNVIQSKFLELTDYPAAASMSFILMAAILVAVAAYARAVGTEQLTGTAV